MSDLHVLVGIASYGENNRRHLDRLLEEYDRMPFNVDVVVLSEAPKILGPGVEVRVGLPSPNPYTLPFAHRGLFSQRANRYDLFIYTEDDTLITERNIKAFLHASEQVAPDELPGFLRAETQTDGRLRFECIHSGYRWLPNTVCRRNGARFAEFSNAHAACTLLTRSQLRRAIDSGGFLVEPHEGRYGVLESAATDAYTQCGFRKLIHIDNLRDFVVLHLSNKFVHRWGVYEADLELQVQSLIDIEAHGGWTGPLVEPESPTPGGRWWKDLYASEDKAVEYLVPGHSGRILVVGAGIGDAEVRLQESGRHVTVMPIDPVCGRCCAARGLDVRMGDLDNSELGVGNFDCVVLPNVLQLVDDPVEWLKWSSRRLSGGGCVVCSIPGLPDNLRPSRLRWTPRGKLRAVRCILWRNRMEHRARRWFARAGFRVDSVVDSILFSETRRYLRKLRQSPVLGFRLSASNSA